MVLDWLFHPRRHRGRERLLAQPFPPHWLPYLEKLPFYHRLDERARKRVRDDARVLIAEKDWEGCGGLELTDEIRVTTAAQAALLLLNIEHDYYPDVRSILVYPSTFVSMPGPGPDGVVREGGAHLGEAWRRGPVILAWDAAKGGAFDPDDGHNLILHEFAHKLDMEDGLADGTPPLADRHELASWVRVMTREFTRLRGDASAGRASVLDHYGASNPAEFFAVATECFFERSSQMRSQHPELYDVLRGYYGQDPAGQE